MESQDSRPLLLTRVSHVIDGNFRIEKRGKSTERVVRLTEKFGLLNFKQLLSLKFSWASAAISQLVVWISKQKKLEKLWAVFYNNLNLASRPWSSGEHETKIWIRLNSNVLLHYKQL